jgi:hypothetical protein
MRAFQLTYSGKNNGGHYKLAGALSIVPSSQLGPATSIGAGSILGILNWTDPDYYCVITSFGLQLLAGLATADFLGVVVHRITEYVADYTGGTDMSVYLGEPSHPDFPALTGFSGLFCIAASAPIVAGTRKISPKMIYGSEGLAAIGKSIVQAGAIYQLEPGVDEPIILKAGQGLEIQLPVGVTLPASKLLQVDIIGSFSKIPTEVVDQFYGLPR